MGEQSTTTYPTRWYKQANDCFLVEIFIPVRGGHFRYNTYFRGTERSLTTLRPECDEQHAVALAQIDAEAPEAIEDLRNPRPPAPSPVEIKARRLAAADRLRRLADEAKDEPKPRRVLIGDDWGEVPF